MPLGPPGGCFLPCSVIGCFRRAPRSRARAACGRARSLLCGAAAGSGDAFPLLHPPNAPPLFLCRLRPFAGAFVRLFRLLGANFRRQKRPPDRGASPPRAFSRKKAEKSERIVRERLAFRTIFWYNKKAKRTSALFCCALFAFSVFCQLLKILYGG